MIRDAMETLRYLLKYFSFDERLIPALKLFNGNKHSTALYYDEIWQVVLKLL